MELSILKEMSWETRNLGVSAYDASSIKNEFDIQALSKDIELLKSFNKPFFVYSRIAKDCLSLSSKLCNLDMYLVESTICPVINLKKSKVLELYSRKAELLVPSFFENSNVEFEVVDSFFDYEKEIKEIAKTSFSDDRFHLDTNCTNEIADNRFVYWIDDLAANSGVAFDILKVDRRVVAFSARKKNELILTGFHGDFVNAGLGEYLWVKVCLLLKNKGYRTCKTLISVNNLSVMNLYTKLGFSFQQTQYSFHYWFIP